MKGGTRTRNCAWLQCFSCLLGTAYSSNGKGLLLKKCQSNPIDDNVAEWSKALGSGPGLFEGAGSNPAVVMVILGD